MKIKMIAAAAVAAMLVTNPAVASKKSFAKHVRMFDRKEAKINDKIDALEARVDKRQDAGKDTSFLQSKIDKNNQNLDRLNDKEDDYRDKHPNASK